jgi:hypothetical protein
LALATIVQKKGQWLVREEGFYVVSKFDGRNINQYTVYHLHIMNEQDGYLAQKDLKLGKCPSPSPSLPNEPGIK